MWEYVCVYVWSVFNNIIICVTEIYFMYVCVYIYIYTHTHIYTYTCAYAYARTYIQACMHRDLDPAEYEAGGKES
jgi:hypothetical protein